MNSCGSDFLIVGNSSEFLQSFDEEVMQAFHQLTESGLELELVSKLTDGYNYQLIRTPLIAIHVLAHQV